MQNLSKGQEKGLQQTTPTALLHSDLPYSKQASTLSRPPSVPVLGRKLSSESIVTVNEELYSKFPIPVILTGKKPSRQLSSSKSTTCIKRSLKTIKNSEQVICCNSSRKSSLLIKSKTSRRLKRKNFEGENVKSTQRSPRFNGKLVKMLVSKSIKEHKKIKKAKEKKEKCKKEARARLKNEVQSLNLITREENLKNFKVKVFKPRFPWGVDEKRVERSTERKKEVENTEKVYSKPVKRLKILKKSIISFTPDFTPLKKCPHTSRPEIKTFIKKQRISRKRSREQEENQKLEKENKRVLQLKYIDIISRQILEKNQKKPKKRLKQGKKLLKRCAPIKWVQKNIDDLSDNESRQCQKNDLNAPTVESPKLRKPLLFSEVPTKKPSLIPSKPSELPSSAKSPSPKGIPSNLERIRKKKLQKQEELSQKFDLVKQKISNLAINLEKPLNKAKAAVKIQAAVRGWLVRIRLLKKKGKNTGFDDSNSWLYKKKYPSSPDSFNEEDEEVKKILGVFHMKNEEKPESPSKFFLQKGKNFSQFSPIFKGQDLSFSDVDEPQEQVILNEGSFSEKSPACDIFEQKNKKIKEKVLKLFKFVLEQKVNLKCPEGLIEDILRIFQDFLDLKDKLFIKSMHQKLENLSNNITMKSFLIFLQEVPDLSHFSNLFNEDPREDHTESSELQPPGQFFPLSIKPSLPVSSFSLKSPSRPLMSEKSLEFLSESVIQSFFSIFLEDGLNDFLLKKVLESLEVLLSELVSKEVNLITQELKLSISEDTLIEFTDQVFRTFGEEIAEELLKDQREDPLDVLSCMQESEIGAGVFQDSFNEIINTSQFLNLITTDPIQLCIFKKMLFDNINEILMQNSFKTHLPWSLNVAQKQKKLKSSTLYCKVLSAVLKWNSCKLGKIFNSFASLGMSEEALNKLRENRIVSVLKQEMLDGEERWVVYEFEETQLKLDISDMVLELLVDEIIENCM